MPSTTLPGEPPGWASSLASRWLRPPSVPTPTPAGRRLRRRTRLERRNRLVEAHRDLVGPLARHYTSCTAEPLDDLLQVGLLGLIRAAELFQPSQGTPFGAFARPHIRGAILHHLRDCAPAVRLPRRQAELQEKLLRLQREHQRQGGHVWLTWERCSASTTTISTCCCASAS